MNEFFSMTIPLWAAAAASLLAIIALIILSVCLVRRRRAGKESAPPPSPPARHIEIGKLHEQGARDGQQDCFAVSDQALIPRRGLLAVVADGMGGLADGDKVSQAAVQAVLDAFTDSLNEEDPERLLLGLTRSAVEAVGRLLGPEKLRSGGSTLVMGLIKDSSLFFLSIGDSRICLYRGGVLTQLNREHTFQRELALRAVNGEIPLDDVYASPQGAGLTSFLGMGELPYIDMPASPIRLLPGDRVVLMSDGVYNALDSGELSGALDGSPEQAAAAINQAISEKNYQNQDNYTAVILPFTGSEPEGGA